MSANTYTAARRVADLSAIAAELNSSAANMVDPKDRRDSGGWLATALRDALQHRLDEETAQRERERLERMTVAEELEAVLTSGVVGSALSTELWARFNKTGRFDLFTGIVAAVTWLEGRASLAELDAESLRRQVVQASMMRGAT